MQLRVTHGPQDFKPVFHNVKIRKHLKLIISVVLILLTQAAANRNHKTVHQIIRNEQNRPRDFEITFHNVKISKHLKLIIAVILLLLTNTATRQHHYSYYQRDSGCIYLSRRPQSLCSARVCGLMPECR